MDCELAAADIDAGEDDGPSPPPQASSPIVLKEIMLLCNERRHAG
jgi:hypothetical protein|tara:strand:- start:2435 stop:2569 length:135 start_codon:yes stop_codon:yes gene_type:complete